jgi:hypothetical protein
MDDEMMEILAHRGDWRQEHEKNSLPALFGALESGFGLETDIRDLDGELVISHDVPRLGTIRPAEELIAFYARGGFTATLALNIKCDGLQERLQALLEKYQVRNYFVFDMAVPDLLGYLKRGMPSYVRRSELEDHPRLSAQAAGTWLDELTDSWIDEAAIAREAAATPRVAIVSPELHRRPHQAQWAAIRSAMAGGVPAAKLQICTDFPNEARRHFA